ncbi:MAG: flagellar hook-length control protein FliK [Nitrospirota bacterium]
MNSIPEMNPGKLQITGNELHRCDTSSSDKKGFASLVEDVYSKSEGTQSEKREIYSSNLVKEDAAQYKQVTVNDDLPVDNNTTEGTGKTDDQQAADSIETAPGDDCQVNDEEGQEHGLKTGELLFSMLQQFMTENGIDSEVSTGGQVSENGLKLGTLIKNMMNEYASETVSGPGPEMTGELETGASEAGSTDTTSGNGLKIGALLNEIVNSYTAEIEANDGSSEVAADTHGDNGLKIGELLKQTRTGVEDTKKEDIKEEMMFAEGEIDISAAADDAEVEGLSSSKVTTGQAESRHGTAGHVEKVNSEDRNANVDIPGNSDNAKVTNSRPESGFSQQFSQENASGGDSLDLAKGRHNVVSDADTININSVNTSNTTYETGRPVQGFSALQTPKTPDTQELLNNVVYVIKGSAKMGVSVEHENLGKLNISLSLEKGLVNVHINTSDKTVSELLENNIQQIIDTLNKDGVSVGEFSIALRDQKEHELNRYSFKNGNGRGIRGENKTDRQHSGLVNIFA